jgi:hypothetical protein
MKLLPALARLKPSRLLITAAIVASVAACTDPSAPSRSAAETLRASKPVGMIVCEGTDCYSSDSSGGAGTSTLTLSSFKSQCLHNDYQYTAATCTPPFVNVTGGTSGSYVTTFFISHCNAPDAEIGPGYCEPYQFSDSVACSGDCRSGTGVHFASSDYEIDVMAETREIGGTQLTGSSYLVVMGPASQLEGTASGPLCNGGADMFGFLPFHELAHNPDGSILRDGNGNPVYVDYGRDPCTSAVYFQNG